jgi:1,4-dihydroxy-2-naphthoyl-CoA hydrolase
MMSPVASIQKIITPLFPGLIGMQLTEVSSDRIIATMKIRPDLCTVGEMAHGGVLMAFADTLGGVGAFINLPQGARTTTVESTTKFMGAVPVGSTVIGECTAFHRGRTTMVWQTLVKSEAGKLCAVVSQTQLILT